LSGWQDKLKDKATSGVIAPDDHATHVRLALKVAGNLETAAQFNGFALIFHAQLDYPPSANRYWRKFRNVIVKSKEARDYQAAVKLRFAGRKPMRGPVVVSLNVFRPKRTGDLDNTLKVLLDALKGVAYVDDSQIVELHAWRNEDKFYPRVVVKVEAIK
jgi:crossover junction endodeoxyribonuclease RusA